MVLIAITLAACSSDPRPAIDAGPPPIVDAPAGCPALPDAAHFDFFGDVCSAAPFPANTVCHTDQNGDHGWCIGPDSGGAGTCRPMAYDASRCPVCPSGTQRFAPAGGSYCAPN